MEQGSSDKFISHKTFSRVFKLLLFVKSAHKIQTKLTERFVYRQISLNVEHGSSDNLRFLKYVTTSTIEHTINTTDSVLRTLKLGKMVLQKS